MSASLSDHAPDSTTSTRQSIDTSKESKPPGLALVTGATGYLGARLVPALLAAGWSVRVLARSPQKLSSRSWVDQVEITAGDATDPEDLDQATAGVNVAYYLLHSMDGGGDFIARERSMAEGFAASCERSTVERIVYLGGLHPHNEPLSEHLYSRKAVGDVFLASKVPTAALQAAVIVGSGSASFEMLRHLTERLPVMVAPRWLDNHIQPIAIADILHYLVSAASLPPEVNREFDVGGPEVLTYREMIAAYAQAAGLQQRRIALVPVLTPWLASHWVGVVTPVPAGVAKPLVGSLVHEVVVKDDRALDDFVGAPADGPTPFATAVQTALKHADEAVEDLPGDTGEPHATAADTVTSDPAWTGRSRQSMRWRTVADSPAPEVWQRILGAAQEMTAVPADHQGDRRVPGSAIAASLKHRLPGSDAAGMRSGWVLEQQSGPAPSPSEPHNHQPGPSDSWHVRLMSTHVLPGVARLTIGVTPAPHSPTESLVHQELEVIPRGLAGQAAWWSGYPLRHRSLTALHSDIADRR